MKPARKESVSNVIYEGIKRGIQTLIDNGCDGSAVVLIYAGIDAMAFVSMPAGQIDVTRSDFVRWAEKYISFPCKEQLSGLDLYGARCSVLHTFSVASTLSREVKCRIIGYVDQSTPEIMYNPAVDPNLVMISIRGLADAFFRGLDRFIIEVFGDPSKAPLARERLRKLLHALPYDRGKPAA